MLILELHPLKTRQPQGSNRKLEWNRKQITHAARQMVCQAIWPGAILNTLLHGRRHPQPCLEFLLQISWLTQADESSKVSYSMWHTKPSDSSIRGNQERSNDINLEVRSRKGQILHHSKQTPYCYFNSIWLLKQVTHTSRIFKATTSHSMKQW